MYQSLKVILTLNDLQVNTQNDNKSQSNAKYFFGKCITKSDSTMGCMENGHKERGSINVIGGRLRQLREGLGLSQAELSDAVKAMVGENKQGKKKGTQSYMSNLENSTGDKLPSVQALRALAIILDTNTDYILGLTNDDRPHGNVDDQVVVTIEDPEERMMLQQAMDALARASKDEREYIIGLVRRLTPKPPRIIGGE